MCYTRSLKRLKVNQKIYVLKFKEKINKSYGEGEFHGRGASLKVIEWTAAGSC